MKWNSDRLIERYYDGEAERIFKEAGIVNPHVVSPTFSLQIRFQLIVQINCKRILLHATNF